MQTNTESKMWGVIDLNAIKGPRHHEIPIKTGMSGEVLMTRTYKLESDKPLPMEPEHAMFFLKDPSFVVVNQAGEIVTPVPVNKEGGIGGFQLGENEVIASYDEVSKEALYKRCKIIPGSEHIKETRTPKEEMIAFLKGKAKPPVGVSRGSEGLGVELDPRVIDSLVAA
jgi:hypothetical protein